MAKYGAKRPTFAPITSEPEAALPEYSEIVTIGRLVQVSVNPAFASGKLYADNELAESADEFVRADGTMETDDITDAVAQVIYGVKVVDGEAEYNTGDKAPRGGLAFFTTLMRRGVKYFKGYYYPCVQAVLGNDTAQTKTDSITFGTSNTSFTVFASKTGAWRRTKEFDTEAEAIAWCDEKLGGKHATIGTHSQVLALESATIEFKELESMEAPELLAFAKEHSIKVPKAAKEKDEVLAVILAAGEIQDEPDQTQVAQAASDLPDLPDLPHTGQ